MKSLTMHPLRKRTRLSKTSRIELHGTAKGRPNSVDRLEGANEKWSANIRDLNVCYKRNEKKKWSSWFMNVEEGNRLFASALFHETSTYSSLFKS